MNYVERHFGDWARDTAHLSMLEDGAYNRLCDLYYVRETPLPVDLLACCRLVRAASKPERDAVRSVLDEFFYLTEEGWRHKRCDLEIERFQAGEPEREVKRANEDNRMRRHREERAALFRSLTDAGQHAAWNIPMGELRTLVQRLHATPPATGAVTQPATAPATPATATHSPLPTPHSPGTRDSEADASAADAAPLTARDRVWALGVPLFGEGGRGLLGKLAKTHGEGVLAKVLAEATLEKPVDPKAWVTAACAARSKPKVNGHEQVDMLADPTPAWALNAGFRNRFEAENAGCTQRTAANFRNGQRIAA